MIHFTSILLIRHLAKYNLSFIDVGEGNGNYVSDFNGANGKVYQVCCAG